MTTNVECIAAKFLHKNDSVGFRFFYVEVTEIVSYSYYMIGIITATDKLKGAIDVKDKLKGNIIVKDKLKGNII